MATITRGRVYTLRKRRPDGGFITYRTCDRSEAQRLATIWGVRITY